MFSSLYYHLFVFFLMKLKKKLLLIAGVRTIPYSQWAKTSNQKNTGDIKYIFTHGSQDIHLDQTQSLHLSLRKHPSNHQDFQIMSVFLILQCPFFLQCKDMSKTVSFMKRWVFLQPGAAYFCYFICFQYFV